MENKICPDCVEFDGVAREAMPSSDWCAKHTGSVWATQKTRLRAAGVSNVVRPPQFRKPAQGYAIEGARLQVPSGEQCAVNVFECVGLDENGFCVVDVAADAEIHFCARHALAAEALVNFAGFRGSVIPRLLAQLDVDGHEPEEVEITCSSCQRTQTFKPNEIGTAWYVMNVLDGGAARPIFEGSFCSTACLFAACREIDARAADAAERG